MLSLVISDETERRTFLGYLYNETAHAVRSVGGVSDLIFGESRTFLRLCVPKEAKEGIKDLLFHHIAEILGIGYKYAFLMRFLKVTLSEREKRMLSLALISADYESDEKFILGRLKWGNIALDGLFTFRLRSLQEKWERVIDYVPESFCHGDLEKFCSYLVGESANKVYLQGEKVYSERFMPLRRSRLVGEEDIEAELILSDAGFVCCLGEVEESVGNFLQKYYAERAIFS